MVTDIVMPRYSLTMEKGTVVKWLKKEGDAVDKGESVVEVEADKVTTELESPVSGVLLKICASEETEVPVGEPIAFIGKPGEPLPEIRAAIEEKKVRETEVVSLARERTLGRTQKSAKIRASPVARSLAKKHGVDLGQIRGTGPGGRITKEDVLQFAELNKEIRAIKEVLPLRGTQKTIAERMARSIKTAAHCSVRVEVDCSRMKAARQRANADLSTKGKAGVSYTGMLVKATAEALRENLILNSTLEGDQLKVFEDVNVGIAVEVEGRKTSGLLVPVVRRADKKSLFEISKESRSLIERARSGIASREDLSGGTFTVTNLGMFGIESFVPIINPPETAILGVGAIRERASVVGGEIEIKPLLNLTLSFDHRVVNGASAARFMQRLKQILENELCEES